MANIFIRSAIGAMAAGGNSDEVDRIFNEAVNLGVILNGDDLNSMWEFDLSGLSLPVARAACRYIVFSLLNDSKLNDVEDLVFITGVGSHHKQGLASTTSLRDYIQELLISDFSPSLKSAIPARAKGSVLVCQKEILFWLRHNS